jgi:hypothetical protein
LEVVDRALDVGLRGHGERAVAHHDKCRHSAHVVQAIKMEAKIP